MITAPALTDVFIETFDKSARNLFQAYSDDSENPDRFRKRRLVTKQGDRQAFEVAVGGDETLHGSFNLNG